MPGIRRLVQSVEGLRLIDSDAISDPSAVYLNEMGAEVFTINRHGIRLHSTDKWISYSDIASVSSSVSSKVDMPEKKITLLLKDNEEIELQVGDGSGRFLDVLPMIGFIRHRVAKSK